jgi:hypothetical protein
MDALICVLIGVLVLGYDGNITMITTTRNKFLAGCYIVAAVVECCLELIVRLIVLVIKCYWIFLSTAFRNNGREKRVDFAPPAVVVSDRDQYVSSGVKTRAQEEQEEKRRKELNLNRMWKELA